MRCAKMRFKVRQALPLFNDGDDIPVLYLRGNIGFKIDGWQVLTAAGLLLDLNGNQMAVGTTVDVEVAIGTVDTSSFTIGNGSAVFNVNYTAPSAAGADNLKVTVTSPESSTETIYNFPITVTP